MARIYPCPFCGSEATVEPCEWGGVAVRCSSLECGAIGPQPTRSQHNPQAESQEDQVIRLWNAASEE